MLYNNQHGFILFVHVFDTFAFLALEVVDLLKRFQLIVHNNVVSTWSMNVIFQTNGFVIYK
jgi:hypothetical protein